MAEAPKENQIHLSHLTSP